VRSRSIVGNIGASLQSIFGGNISIYTSLCERAREDAFNDMLTHAVNWARTQWWASGICHRNSPGITEVLGYDTAVSVERSG